MTIRLPLAVMAAISLMGCPSAMAEQEMPPATDAEIEVAPGDAIQGAMDRLAARGGGTVFLSAGIHRLDAPLWLHSNITLRGCGPATELRASDSLTEVAIGTKHDHIHNVTLVEFSLVGPGKPEKMTERRDLHGARLGVMGIFMAFETGKGKYVRLERLRITRWTRMGVHLKGITHLLIQGCDIDCSSAYNSLYHNVYLRRARDVRVVRNLFRNSPVGNGFQASFCERIHIADNQSIDNAGHGIRVAASDEATISGNTVLRNRGQAGIWLNIEKGRPCRHVTVRDNTVQHNLHSGLAIRNTYHCLVEDNDIRHNGVDVSFRNARDTALQRNRFDTTREEKTNTVTFEDNTREAP